MLFDHHKIHRWHVHSYSTTLNDDLVNNNNSGWWTHQQLKKEEAENPEAE